MGCGDSKFGGGLFAEPKMAGMMQGKMRGMMNQTRTLMLHSGAIRQVGGRQRQLENCLRGLIELNPTLEGREQALALLN